MYFKRKKEKSIKCFLIRHADIIGIKIDTEDWILQKKIQNLKNLLAFLAKILTTWKIGERSMSMNVRLNIYKIITKSEYFFTSNVDWFSFIYILTITIQKFVNGMDVKFDPSKGNKRAINEQRIFLTIDNRKLPRFEIVYWTYDESGKILMSIKCSRSKNIFFKQMKGNTSKAEAKVK